MYFYGVSQINLDEMIEIPTIERKHVQTLQVNVGALCNQSCSHCHTNAGPNCTEIMSNETVEEILDFVCRERIDRLDITGGEPELNPHLRELISGARPFVKEIVVRSNLTAVYKPEYRDFIQFFKKHHVKLVCSLPCYLKKNVDAQRGAGVYDKSIEVLKILNRGGYGIQNDLKLDLVYNPNGPFLPASQAELEKAYKEELKKRHGLVFNNLITLTNMPIGRFLETIEKTGKYQEYMKLFHEHYNPELVGSVMCCSLLSVGWNGKLYDCDFNLALNLPIKIKGKEAYISDVLPKDLSAVDITTGEHCLGCTAGAGSSCFGTLG